MFERIVSIDRMETAVSLFGAFDENIKLIEQAFDVKIISRGTDLKIQGTEETADLAARTIHGLLTLLAKGETLGEQNVRYVISLVREGADD